jgi:hypothetical protein
MTTEFNELLPVPPSGKTQIWIVGQRDEALCDNMNETPDRFQITV